jgi:tRNA nucleotidyltransferase (CCA-adding enzyme)
MSGAVAPVLPTGATVYVVGGAVRDGLLGVKGADRDWVIVGARPEQLIEAGFKPVGQDFPVFLHPQTREEYALARTERKTAPGYRGFVFHAAPDVSLEQDLARRDLTINAMAQAVDGRLIDPFGGQRDLADRVLRHVGPAFSEDPVRILRLARFAARFGDFRVDPETEKLLCTMVDAGEVDALVPERVWQELARGLMERQPSRLFEVLHGCGALARLLPELNRVWNERSGRLIDAAALNDEPLDVRWALLMIDLTSAEDYPAIEAMAQRLRVPTELRAMWQLVARELGPMEHAFDLPPETLLEIVERCDGIRRPDRFLRMLKAISYRHLSGQSATDRDQAAKIARFVQALSAARGVDAGAVARRVASDREQFDGISSDLSSPDGALPEGASPDGAAAGATVSERIRLAVQLARVDAIARSVAR